MGTMKCSISVVRVFFPVLLVASGIFFVPLFVPSHEPFLAADLKPRLAPRDAAPNTQLD